MANSGLISIINGVVDTLQNTAVNLNHRWSPEQKDRVNLFIDNAQDILKALTDDIPNDDQFLELIDDLNQAMSQSDWLQAQQN